MLVIPSLLLFVARHVCSREHHLSSTDANPESRWGRELIAATPRVVALQTDSLYYPRLVTNSVSCFSATRSAMKERCSHGMCLNTFPYFYNSTLFGVTTVCVPAEHVIKHTFSETLRLYELNAMEVFRMGSSLSSFSETTERDGRYHTEWIRVRVAEIFGDMNLLCDEKKRCTLVTPQCLKNLPKHGGGAPEATNVHVGTSSITVDVPDREDCAMSFDYHLDKLQDVPVPLVVALSSTLLPIFHTNNMTESIVRRGRTDSRCGYQRFNTTHVLRCSPSLMRDCLWCGRVVHDELVVHTFNISVVDIPYFASVAHHASAGVVHVIQTVFVFFFTMLVGFVSSLFEEYSGSLSIVFTSLVVFVVTRFFLDTLQSLFVAAVYIVAVNLVGGN